MFKTILFSLALGKKAPMFFIKLVAMYTNKCLPNARVLQGDGILVWLIKKDQSDGKISDHFVVQKGSIMFDRYSQYPAGEIGDTIRMCPNEEYIIVAKAKNYDDFNINNLNSLVNYDKIFISKFCK